MSQFQICPYWLCESRERPEGNQRDIQFTELHVTNPGDTDGLVEMIFYEARGDGSFQRSEWAGGRWNAPAKWQRVYRPDPSRVYGPSFFTYGWFELWMSSNAMVAEVQLSRIGRSLVARETESISQRSVPLITKPAPYFNGFIETMLRIPMSPLKFPPGTTAIDADQSMFDPRKPTE